MKQIEKKLYDELLANTGNVSQGGEPALDYYKKIASVYARVENSVAVLSDLKSDMSYIIMGGVAERLGLGKKGETLAIPSIWERDIFNHIHPADMGEKYAQEYYFLQYVKRQKPKNRENYCLKMRLRMKDVSGQFVVILHRVFYFTDSREGKLRFVMCLYDFAESGSAAKAVVVNTLTGQRVELKPATAGELLTEREVEILRLVRKGATSQEIAERLSISKNTVSRHRQNILLKLQVPNSLKACDIAADLGLLD